jgi:quercetin dioxygenase-like cupin family protein
MVVVTIYQPFDSLRPYRIWDGAVARAIHGERQTVAIVDLEGNLDVPEHSHDNEQLGFVLEGEITMTIGGDSRALHAGDTYVILSNIPHSARSGPEGAKVVDVFAPVRADWERAPRLDPAAGGWPSRASSPRA